MVDEVEDEEKSNKILFDVGSVRIVTGKSIVGSRVVFSKDSRSLFSAYGNEVRVHSVQTGERVSIFRGHTGEVSDLCLSEKNSLQLLSCCLDGLVIFWDISDGSIVYKCKSEIPLYGISVHKDYPNKLFLVQEGKHDKGTLHLGIASIIKSKVLKDVPLAKCKRISKVDKPVGTYCFSSQGDVACVSDTFLQIYFFKEKQLKKYPTQGFVCVAFHPTDLCVATGHHIGKIIIWRNLGVDLDPVCTKLHWHAHPVASIAFSFDGAYLYSGGEESVLVFWQFESGHKQFKPRLGAPITHVANSKDDTVIAVCHTDNVINLISAVDLSVVNVVQGLTRASNLCFGLVADPLSNSLVLNSREGVLQFYRPDTDSLAFTLNIVRQNYISKSGKGDLLQMTVVEHVSFSTDGTWLATVERRDDGKTTPENRLKFWKFDKETQRHLLNTCVDPPHEGRVVAVEFQPESVNEPRAMTAAVDGKFKIWVLREQQVITGVRDAWQCQSVGFLRDEPVQDADFSSDGSLLAVAYNQAVTIWDPITNELQTTLYSPFPQNIKNIKFGRQSCSHVLLASTKHDYLVAWSLLSCTVLWSVTTDVLSILPDPLSHLMAVFVPGAKHKVHVYIFDPRSAVPLAIVQNVLKTSQLASAAFQPNMEGLTIRQANRNITMAKLFFMNKQQVLLTIDSPEKEDSSPTKDVYDKSEDSEFHRVFGKMKPAAVEDVAVPLPAVPKTGASQTIRELFHNTPSHVLPPVSTLSSTFLRSLLIQRTACSDHPADELNDADDDVNNEDVSLGNSTASEDELDISDSEIAQSKETTSSVGKQTLVDMSNEQEHNLHEAFKKSNFAWMKDLFDGLE